MSVRARGRPRRAVRRRRDLRPRALRTRLPASLAPLCHRPVPDPQGLRPQHQLLARLSPGNRPRKRDPRPLHRDRPYKGRSVPLPRAARRRSELRPRTRRPEDLLAPPAPLGLHPARRRARLSPRNRPRSRGLPPFRRRARPHNLPVLRLPAARRR